MKHYLIMLYTVGALLVSGCEKAADASTPGCEGGSCHHHECHCKVELVGPVWRLGTLCQKGELSQGHGKNPQDQEVSGCYTLKHSCDCAEHQK